MSPPPPSSSSSSSSLEKTVFRKFCQICHPVFSSLVFTTINYVTGYENENSVRWALRACLDHRAMKEVLGGPYILLPPYTYRVGDTDNSRIFGLSETSFVTD
jgi:hypothetical protein